MKFAIISHVPHGFRNGRFFAYGPYVREMNIWTNFVDQVIIVAPLGLIDNSAIHINYSHPNIQFEPVSQMNLLGIKSALAAFVHTPNVAWKIYKAMRSADHIHLRCPGNIGLIGCLVQILFPKIPKTAKYAGNWDPEARQPLTYRIQKWILSNTFLTRNMQVLAYGRWPGSTKNIKAFFTATYFESDKAEVFPRLLEQPIKFIFVGTLTIGKRPLYAIKIVQRLNQLGYNAILDFYGEGKEMEMLKKYCSEHHIDDLIFFHHNQTEAVVRLAYKRSHFIMLPSQSEGWPKVIAEAMFWGCLPAASAVSCVPYMLNNGTRGILLKMNEREDVEQFVKLIGNQVLYHAKVMESIAWSREYTLDLFQNEIKALLNQ